MKILIASDMSGVGNCSLVANIAILTKLGHRVSPLATSVFSCQTAFPNFKFLSNDRLAEFFADIETAQGVDACFFGFATDTNQLEALKGIATGQRGKGVSLIVDPIMADNGGLYPIYNDDFVEKMKELCSGADLITPNLTEACLLCDVDYFALSKQSSENGYFKKVAEIFCDILEKLNVKSAVITGVESNNILCNIVFENNEVKFVTNDKINSNYSGTGDVFASVVAGKVLSGATLLDAVVCASQFVYNSISATDPLQDIRFGTDFHLVLDKLEK